MVRDMKSKRNQSVLIESLESRTLMANTSGMDAIAQHYSAPPAIVEYVGLETSTATDTTTKQGEAQPQLGVFDSTWGGPKFGRSSYWTGTIAWHTSAGFDTSRSRVEKIAKISRDGGPSIHNNIYIAPGSLTVLDFESPLLERKSPNYYADRLRWFKAFAPNVMVGTYGIPLNPLNLDQQARNNASDKASFDNFVLARREVIEAVDFICMDVYLLGPNNVDRDLKAMKNTADNYRRLFPNKPIIPFVWGAYHTSWNPAGSVISQEVAQRYADTCRQSFDGVLVWGKRSDNETLIAELAKPGANTLPHGRVANWANDPAANDPNTSGGAGEEIDGEPEIIP
jgi:hypothetical protein